MDAGGTAEGLLVGRDDEFAALHALLGGAAEHQHAFVIGEAGIGKTVLAAAAAARASSDGVVVLVGACLPLSESLPLLPFGDVVRAAAEADGAAFASALADNPPFVGEAVDRLMSAAPVDGEGPRLLGARQQTFVAVRLLLSALARHRRVAIVIEDVHWADATTVDLLEYLLAPPQHTGVPIVMTFRDHPLAERDAAGAALRDEAVRHAGVLRLALGVLGPEEVAAQIAALTGAPPDPQLSASIYSRSQGNPFFVDQLVAHLSGGELAASMPPGLATLLLNRLTGLDEGAEAVVAALAVAARPLRGAELAQISAMSIRDVLTALRTLERHGLLRPHPDGYDLRHHLLAQAVSADLLDEPRRDLHRAIGDVLADRSGDLFAAEAAEHYERARADEAELHARIRAARYAERVFAWPDAERHWRRALHCYGPVVPRPDDQTLAWEIYSGLHQTLRAVGSDQGLEVARAAYAQLVDSSASEQRARLCLLLGLHPENELDEILAFIDEGLAACESNEVRVRLLLARTVALEFAGDLDGATAAYELAAVAAKSSAGAELCARVDVEGAYLLMRSGRSSAAIAAATALLGRLDELPGWDMPCRVGVDLSDILLKSGELVAAERAARTSLTVAAHRGLDTFGLSWLVRSNLVEALTEGGQVTAARAALAEASHLPRTRLLMWAQVSHAYVLMLEGELESSASLWGDLDGFDVASLNLRLDYVQRRVEVELWCGRPDDALRRGFEVLRDVHSTDDSASAGVVLLLSARACADLSSVHVDRRTGGRSDKLAALRAAMKIDPLTAGPMRPTADAVALQWAAELTRASETDEPDQWAATAVAWKGYGRPHRMAYALWREAECLLRVRGRTREAHEVLSRAAVASDQHVPLHTAITDLARRARIDLRRPPDAVEPVAAPRPFGLTERECAVLALVAEGRSNAEIGAQLYMSPKTASVHVSAILRKLGVATRAHAAAVAERAGLLGH